MDRFRARVGWQARTLGYACAICLFLAGWMFKSWWQALLIIPAAAGFQMALNSAFFMGQYHVHRERLEEMEREEVERFLDSIRDDGL